MNRPNHRRIDTGLLPTALALLGHALLLAPGSAAALTGDREQPIHIRADRVELDEPAGVSVYTGNVLLRQGTTVLEADRLKVFTQEGTLQRAEADGNPARFRQRPDNSEVDVNGEAKRIDYQAVEGNATLQGSAHVWRGRDEFRGEQIVYDTRRSQVRAQGTGNGGDGRVHAIIYPKNAKEGGSGADKKP